MKRTKSKKRKKMSRTKKKTNASRKLLIQNVIAYHSHLVDWVTRQTDQTLLAWVHPSDRQQLGIAVGIITPNYY